MKKSIIVVLYLVILSTIACNRLNMNNSWEIIGTTLYIYSDEGVVSLVEDKTKIKDCEDYETVIFGDSVTEIPDSFFANNPNITSVQIGNGIITIGNKAFYSCVQLSAIKWSNSLRHIGTSAFENTAIIELSLPVGLEKIDDFAFSNCSMLLSCSIPNTVKEMGCNFTDCTSLQQVQLSSSLEELADYSLSGCTSLRQIWIPSSIRILVSVSKNSQVFLILIEPGIRLLVAETSAYMIGVF